MLSYFDDGKHVSPAELYGSMNLEQTIGDLEVVLTFVAGRSLITGPYGSSPVIPLTFRR